MSDPLLADLARARTELAATRDRLIGRAEIRPLYGLEAAVGCIDGALLILHQTAGRLDIGTAAETERACLVPVDDDYEDD